MSDKEIVEEMEITRCNDVDIHQQVARIAAYSVVVWIHIKIP